MRKIEKLLSQLSLIKILLANSNGPLTLNEADQHGLYLLLEDLEEAVTNNPDDLPTIDVDEN